MAVHVAPFMGAWIETPAWPGLPVTGASRPSWARGLKLAHVYVGDGRERSRPSWARGLKQEYAQYAFRTVVVAPFMGAWIETQGKVEMLFADVVAPFMGAWIETLSTRHRPNHRRRRALHGRVD